MAYTDDWENLMNGVFGPGGKLRFDTQKTPPEKPGLPDMNAALLEQQKKLDEMLKKQNAELRRDTTQEALAQSRKMLEDMEADGLLAKGTTEVRQEHLGSFEGLAAEVKKTVLGQDAFVDGVVRAMRRPFVLGTEAPTARNVILLCGAPGTGRHFTLTETARCMAVRGLLQSDKLAVMDLALYPNPGAEKLFLQDLYAAIHAPGEILVFEHYESCYPGFLKTLADLAVKGSAPLSSRYLVNKEGILVDAGTALAPGAVSRITPCGKYLVFFSRKGRETLADKFGAAFVSAAGAACSTLAARFMRSFTSEMTHSWSPPPGTSCQICSTAPTSAPMPTVSTHLPPAQEERRRTVPSGVCSTFHIWDVPPTSSHRCSHVPLAVPVMVRSSSLPEARLRMRYTPSPSRTKLHSCSGLWSYFPRRTVPPSLLPSTA